MRLSYLAWIFLIFLGTAVAWSILGGTVSVRTETSLRQLREQVGGLWGRPLHQNAPTFTIQETVHYRDKKGKRQSQNVYHDIMPDASDIQVKLRSDARRKGLLWYRTYAMEFSATYTVKHDYTREPYLIAKFAFPVSDADYDDFVFSINDKQAPAGNEGAYLKRSVALSPGKTANIKIHYKSRGLDTWTYSFGEGVTQVKNLNMVAETDFEAIDFPPGSLSPTTKQQTPGGWKLAWESTNLMTGHYVGVDMPEQVNPGPMVARITYFAPVGLLFFVAVLVILGLMRGQNLHPMHYFFVCGGFFAFHLLMAYAADHLELDLTFLICAIVSVLLVVSYLIRAIGAGFALKIAAPAQLIYLVVFSYTFFFKGYTGLAITVASIVTLAILMHVTAKVDWESRFKSPERPVPPTPPAPPAPPSPPPVDTS